MDQQQENGPSGLAGSAPTDRRTGLRAALAAVAALAVPAAVVAERNGKHKDKGKD